MDDRLKQLQEQKTQCDIRNKNQRVSMSNLRKKYDTLNKGIDELIKKYEEKLQECGINFEPLIKEIMQDLKKLKGE